MRDAEEQPNFPASTPESPASASASDHAADETLHISSLRPSARRFSMRRLLNGASLALAALVVLALALLWLPGALSGMVGQKTNAPATGATFTRGAGWKPIGPAWAQDVTFTTDATAGYVCGAVGPRRAPVLVSRFAIDSANQLTWGASTTAASGSRCEIAVSPAANDDVALVASDCATAACDDGALVSRVYRSYDGGETWTQLRLPATVTVNGAAWAGSTLFLRVWGQMGGSAKASAHLLVSREGFPLTEVDPRSLVGKAAQFDYMALYSSGATLYVALNPTPCSGYCLVVARTSDAGGHWARSAATYANRPITPASAQPGSATLIGWVLRLSDQRMALLRSDDQGRTWSLLPDFPVNPSTGGATIFALPDGAVYAASYGQEGVVYALRQGTSDWRTVAPISAGMPLAVQYDAEGHAIAAWGQAHEWSPGSYPPGLQYYPLHNSR